MDVARQEAERSAKEGTVIVAEEQTIGRGRFGKRWVSNPGDSLSLSILLYPTRWVCSRLSIAAPVAVLRAIKLSTGLSPRLKWPNDVLLSGKKACGILVETSFQEQEVRYAIVGIGINVNRNPSEDPGAGFLATSLATELGRPLPREALLQAVLEEMGAIYTTLTDCSRLWGDWRSSLETLGKAVQVRWGDHVEQGVAEDVDENGNLLLRRPDGTVITLNAGEVTFQT